MTTSPVFRAIPESLLTVWPGNPRQTIDPVPLKELAASVAHTGVLQSLLVRPNPVMPDGCEVIAGQRRLLAVRYNIEHGIQPSGYPLPCIVRDITDAEALVIAITENGQRAPTAPIEEAEAYVDLIRLGHTEEAIAAAFGMPLIRVQRRLALGNLIPAARDMVRSKETTIEWGMALTIATPATQAEIVEAAKKKENDWARDPGVLRTRFSSAGIPVAYALFDRSSYTDGTIRDLFSGSTDSERFADTKQFWTLQNAAVAKIKQHHQDAGATVRVMHTAPDLHKFQKTALPADGSRTGTISIIHVDPLGRVAIHEGLTEIAPPKGKSSKVAAKPAKGPVKSPTRGKNAPAPEPHSQALYEYAADHRAACVQALLFGELRLAIATICLVLLGRAGMPHLSTPTYRFQRPADERQSEAFTLLLNHHNKMRALLGLSADPQLPEHQITADGTLDSALDRLLSLPDADLADVFKYLTARRVGHQVHNKTSSASIVTALARHLPLSIRALWTPDVVYLAKLRTEALRELSKTLLDATEAPKAATLKKSELVTFLASAFAKASDGTGTMSADTSRRLNQWLPDEMVLPTASPLSADPSADPVDAVA